eukprot:3424794-Pyramimonas_sp.AAC.1
MLRYDGNGIFTPHGSSATATTVQRYFTIVNRFSYIATPKPLQFEGTTAVLEHYSSGLLLLQYDSATTKARTRIWPSLGGPGITTFSILPAGEDANPQKTAQTRLRFCTWTRTGKDA